jgi:O-antigen/teichoic acid export membrane protein/glycosyltransferase involved in cell wall biosynthesis
MSEVVRQISERLVAKGHEVTVATSRDPERQSDTINGVKVVSFSVSGKSAVRIFGDANSYKRFLLESSFDVITNFAAQQWATDLMLPILEQIKARKVFVPTGFSALGAPAFSEYFQSMRSWMRQYDACVFLSRDYRDINFASEAGVTRIAIIPNGASEEEFSGPSQLSIRKDLELPEDKGLLIHVSGYLSAAKGQVEAVRIFSNSRLQNAVLLLVSPGFEHGWASELSPRNLARGLWWLLRGKGLRGFASSWQIGAAIGVSKRRNERHGRSICRASLDRERTIAIFKEADLLLFPSWVECSPLVLFEAAASRTPFLVTDVGNAREIIGWTGGGEILPGTRLNDHEKSIIADTNGGAEKLNRLWFDSDRRQSMASSAHTAWRRDFTWERIAGLYEELYERLVKGRSLAGFAGVPSGPPQDDGPRHESSSIETANFRTRANWRITKEAWVLFAAQGLTVLGSFVGVRLLTEFLDPAQLGRVSLGLTAGTFANQLLFGPLANGASRFFAPSKEEKDLGGYFGALGSLFWRAAVGMCMVATLAALAFLFLAPHAVMISLFAAALAIFSGGVWTIQSIFNAARRRGMAAISQVSDNWLKYVVALGALLIFAPTAETVMGSYCLSALVVFAIIFVLLRRQIPSSSKSSTGKARWSAELWQYSVPFAAWGVFTWAQLASDRWALAMYSDAAAVGLYSVAYQLGYTPMAMLTGLTLQVAGPILFEKAGLGSSRERLAGTRHRITQLMYVSLGLTLAVCLFFLMFGGIIMDVLTGSEYHSSSVYLPWLSLSGGIFAAGQILSLEFLAQLKTAVLARVKILTAVLGTALNFVGASLYGISGVVAAGVIFAFVYLIWITALSVHEGSQTT